MLSLVFLSLDPGNQSREIVFLAVTGFAVWVFGWMLVVLIHGKMT